MKKIILAILIVFTAFSNININYANDTIAISDSDIDKILKAKDIVRGMVNYPDTLVFHDLYTKVNGNTVTLKFTAKNGFGVPETHTKDIKVN